MGVGPENTASTAPPPAEQQTTTSTLESGILRVGGDGSYRSISQAIADAPDHAIIQVAAGVYDENIVIESPKNIFIQGGWNSDFSKQDHPGNITEINGLGKESVVRISFGKGVSAHLVLEGLTLRNGRAEQGGGLKIVSGGDKVSVEIKDSTISENRSMNRGGGIYILSLGKESKLDVTITNCIISANVSEDEGGGLRAEAQQGSRGTLIMTGNQIVNNSVVNDQVGASDGGGLAFYVSQSGLFNVYLSNNIITDNSAGFGGGLFGYAWGGEGALLKVNMQNNVIARNQADHGGAMMIISGQSDPEFSKPGGQVEWSMSNNTITENRGLKSAGALHIHSGSTFGDGGEISLNSRNDILWKNEDPNNTGTMVIVEPGKNGTARAEFNHSLVESIGKLGEGEYVLNNILQTDPLLTMDAGGMYILQNGSPAIDAGDPGTEFNDGSIPPGQGSERNDLGAFGGPGNILWRK